MLRLRSQLRDSAARRLAGSHDNSASCHPGADSVRHFPARLFPGPSPSRGSSLLVSKVKFRGLCARSSSSRSFLRHPSASAFPRPSAQPQPGLLLDPPPRNITSWPIVSGSPLALGHWSRSPAAGRSGESPPGPAPAAAAAPSRFLRPGIFGGSDGVSAGGRGGNGLWGFPGQRGRPTPRGSAARERGPLADGGSDGRALLFGTPGAQFVLRIPTPPRAASQTPGTGHRWLRRNTPFLATNQGGGHPNSSVRQLRHCGPRPSFWRLTWVCTHCVTLDKSLNLLSLGCLIS